MPIESCAPDPKTSSWFDLARKTYTEWSNDKASRLAAAFSYYAIFSIGPLLIIAITLISMIYGQKAANDQIRPQITSMVGDKAAEFIQNMIKKAAFSPSLSWAGIISVILILYAATNLFVSLQDALNTIFNVTPKPNRGIKGILKDRALSFLSVFIVGAFVLASVVLSTLLAAITKDITVGNPALTALLLQTANFLVSVAVFTGLFAFMFKYLPDIQIDWRDTLIGAVFTAILFSLARIALGYYLGRSSTAGPFGAAGSLVVVMLFIYYSSQIFFLGAEFTQVWACRNGSSIVPSANAISTKPPKKEKKAPKTEGHWAKTGKKDPKNGWIWTTADPENTRRPPDRLHPPMQFPSTSPNWLFPAITALVVVPLAWIFLRRRSAS